MRLLAAAAVFFTVAHGDFRVAANARLEGAVQRVVVAPFDGFVASAQARAGRFDAVSRESMLLANNVLLVVAAGAVLLGTLYPLIVDALGGGKISVGPPYFNTVFVPLTLPLLVLVALGPVARWKRRLKRSFFRLRTASSLWSSVIARMSSTFIWAISITPRCARRSAS